MLDSRLTNQYLGGSNRNVVSFGEEQIIGQWAHSCMCIPGSLQCYELTPCKITLDVCVSWTFWVCTKYYNPCICSLPEPVLLQAHVDVSYLRLKLLDPVISRVPDAPIQTSAEVAWTHQLSIMQLYGGIGTNYQAYGHGASSAEHRKRWFDATQNYCVEQHGMQPKWSALARASDECKYHDTLIMILIWAQISLYSASVLR